MFEQPSFVSDWKIIRSQSNLYSDVTFHHELNVLPYKVVTEVMVESNQQKYTFKAMGSSYRDDDYWTPYGGIVYVYNETVVRVMAPNNRGGSNRGVIIYTGKFLDFTLMYTLLPRQMFFQFLAFEISKN